MKAGYRWNLRTLAGVRVALVALLALAVAGPAGAQLGAPAALGRPERTRVDKMWRLKVPISVATPCVALRYPAVEVIVPRAALERFAHPNAPGAPSKHDSLIGSSHDASPDDAAAILRASSSPVAKGACAVLVVDPGTREAQDHSRIVGSLIEAGVAGVRDLSNGTFADRVVVHYIDETGVMCCGGYTTYSLPNADQPFLRFSRWIS